MAPYNAVLQLPDYRDYQRNQKGDYEQYLATMLETEPQRRALGEEKMESLQAFLGKIPGLSDLYSKTTNLVSNLLEGKLLNPDISAQMGAAQAAQHGVGGSGAGAMVGLQQWGKDVAQSRVQGLAQVPSLMAGLMTSFGGNIARDPMVMGPQWQGWQSNLEMKTANIFDRDVAQAKAVHQVQQLNEQYAVQEAARESAHQRMMASANAARQHSIRVMGSQQSYNIFMQNQAQTGFNSPAQGYQRSQRFQRESRFRQSPRAERMASYG